MPPITNLLGRPMFALKGRVATMDPQTGVIPDGIVYIQNGRIAAVLPTQAPPPPGFEQAVVINTEGTIFPGMIELHNHLPYNILPLWKVPGTFQNRGQWSGKKEYRRDISGPMNVLGKTAGYTEAIVRYVECKSILGGVTTSQGIALFSNAQIRKFFAGLVRNVEMPDAHLQVPKIETRVADVDATDINRFWERLQGFHADGKKLLLHLSEGVKNTARKYFTNLKLADGSWAINPALIGIHALDLQHAKGDFSVMAEHKAAMVWSPLSNLLLYGQTAEVGKAIKAGVPVALGSDWSPSGSKNLLGELKVASLLNDQPAMELGLSSEDLVAMVTRQPAAMIGWDQEVGTIKAGKVADLLVIQTNHADAYRGLIEASEKDILLTCIDGVPRYGSLALMKRFETPQFEEITVGNRKKRLYLENPSNDAFVKLVNALTLEAATNTLKNGLAQLKSLASDIGSADPFDLASTDLVGDKWVLDMDYCAAEIHLHEGDTYSDNGSLLPVMLEDEGFDDGQALAEIVTNNIRLDPLTVDDDPDYLSNILEQPNPANRVDQLPDLYDASVVLPASVPDYLKNGPPEVKNAFRGAMSLEAFLSRTDFLSMDDRITIAKHAIHIFTDIYVHLPHKRNLYGLDPVRQIEQLISAHENRLSDAISRSSAEFHFQMMEIFASVRDLHTRYFLPEPYRSQIAFLPFRIEPYYERKTDDRPQYMVTNVVDFLGSAHLKPGVRVLSWNNIPIHRLVERQARLSFGSNASARMARSVDGLTIRPLAHVFPPDETQVMLRFTDGEKTYTETFKWMVAPVTAQFIKKLKDKEVEKTLAYAIGEDLQTYAIGQVKKLLFTPYLTGNTRSVRDSNTIKPSKIDHKTILDEPVMNTEVFNARVLTTPEKQSYAYIRLFTFKTVNQEEAIRQMIQLFHGAFKNTEGLIIDVRGNGGGSIRFAESLLQLFTDQTISPQKSQFIATPYTQKLCQKFSDPANQEINLAPWLDSISNLALPTGNDYSLPFPITPPEMCNDISMEDRYLKPSILVFDALSYSATDIFIAGYVDHHIGKIMGTAPNSGAGGANNWSYDQLNRLLPITDPALPDLPDNVDFMVAVRRTLRTGEKEGYPVEDLGVAQENFYKMSAFDILNKNRQMISEAIKRLQN